MVFQFHDDTTVNKFRIVVLLRQIWMYGEKEMVLGKEKGKTKFRGRGSVEKLM